MELNCLTLLREIAHLTRKSQSRDHPLPFCVSRRESRGRLLSKNRQLRSDVHTASRGSDYRRRIAFSGLARARARTRVNTRTVHETKNVARNVRRETASSKYGGPRASVQAVEQETGYGRDRNGCERARPLDGYRRCDHRMTASFRAVMAIEV